MKRELNQNSAQYVFYESGKDDGTMANQNIHLDDNYSNFCFRCSILIFISDLHYKIKLLQKEFMDDYEQNNQSSTRPGIRTSLIIWLLFKVRIIILSS